MTSFLRVITFGLYKEPKKALSPDYYDQQAGKCWYWRKDILLVTFRFDAPREVLEAFQEWKESAPAIAPRLFIAAVAEEADIVIAIEDAVKSGGVTTRVPSKSDPREIAWAKISIAKSEKGKSLKRVVFHELGHALGLTHDGAADTDIMRSPIKTDKISDRDKATLRKIYENRPVA